MRKIYKLERLVTTMVLGIYLEPPMRVGSEYYKPIAVLVFLVMGVLTLVLIVLVIMDLLGPATILSDPLTGLIVFVLVFSFGLLSFNAFRYFSRSRRNRAGS